MIDRTDPRQPSELPATYNQGERDAIISFLSRYLASAEKAAARTKAAAKMDPSGAMRRNHQYWKNAAAGIRWCLGHARRLR